MTDQEFLNWLADRLVNVYGESPNVDFVQRLRGIADHSGIEPVAVSEEALHYQPDLYGQLRASLEEECRRKLMREERAALSRVIDVLKEDQS